MYWSIAETIMENMINDLRKRILPIMMYCQANKGDLWLFEEWRDREDAGRKLFYAYYSGLFCRILCMLETDHVLRHIVRDCNALLDKYNWYDIQKEDLEKCKEEGPYGCEVPDALQYIDGIDNVSRKDSGILERPDPNNIKMDHAIWTFADVRGSIKL